MLGKSRIAVFFQWIVVSGSWCSKSRLAKAAGAEVAVQQRNEKWHAAVARSAFASQNVKKLRGSGPFFEGLLEDPNPGNFKWFPLLSGFGCFQRFPQKANVCSTQSIPFANKCTKDIFFLDSQHYLPFRPSFAFQSFQKLALVKAPTLSHTSDGYCWPMPCPSYAGHSAYIVFVCPTTRSNWT